MEPSPLFASGASSLLGAVALTNDFLLPLGYGLSLSSRYRWIAEAEGNAWRGLMMKAIDAGVKSDTEHAAAAARDLIAMVEAIDYEL